MDRNFINLDTIACDRPPTYPMFLLSQLVHDHHLKVVITGEGSDEFLGE